MKRRQWLSRASAGTLAATGGLSAPAVIAADTTELNIVSSWPRDHPGAGLSAQRLAARIAVLSAQRIKVSYRAAGEAVGAFEVFDEVARGNYQAYTSSELYWTVKHPAFAYFGSVPFGMTHWEWSAWIKFRNGQALWDELSADYGIKALPCGGSTTQMGGWFNKAIESRADLQGLKMRMPGLGGDMLAKLGAQPVALPGDQIYSELASGAIDAAEWFGPYNDYFMRFHEVAKYYYGAGVHEPGGGLAFGMNKRWWQARTRWEKAIITAACMEEHAAQASEALANNGLYLRKLVEDHGVELRMFNDSIFNAFGEGAAAVFADMREHSTLAAQIDEDFQSTLRELGGYMAIGDFAYAAQRNRIFNIHG